MWCLLLTLECLWCLVSYIWWHCFLSWGALDCLGYFCYSLLLVLLVAWGVFSLIGVLLLVRGAFYLIGVPFVACVPLSVIIVIFTYININLVIVLPSHAYRALLLLYVVYLTCVRKNYIIKTMVKINFNTPTFNCTSYSCANNLL